MGISDVQQTEAGILSFDVQPAGRSLSALWPKDRATGKADAIHVVMPLLLHGRASSRPSTSSLLVTKTWMPGTKPGHDEHLNTALHRKQHFGGTTRVGCI